MKNKIRKRYSLLREYIYTYSIAKYIFIYGITVCMSLVEPALAKMVTKYSIYSFNINYVTKFSLIWLLIFFIRLLIELKRNIMDIHYDIKIKTECQKRILRKIMDLRYKDYSKESDGYWMARCIDDVNNLDSYMPKVVVGSFWSLVQFLVTIIIMINMSWKLSIFAVLFVIGDVVANFMFPLTKYYRDYAQKRVQISHELNDILKNELLIKCSNIQNNEVQRFGNILRNVYNSFFTREKYNCLRNWGRSIVGGISTPILYLIGGLNIIKGNVGIDTFISFMMYFGILRGSFSPVSTFFIRIRNSSVYLDRINEVLSLPEEDKNGTRPLLYIKDIVFRDLSLIIDNNKVLDKISFSIAPNEKIAIMGESGSGKSSLVKILLGLNEFSSGQILINNTNLKEYSIDEIRKKIAYISQEGYLFNRSIYENIALWDNKKDIQVALDISMCNEFINSERDLESSIDGHSNNFSGGEKQRISIARQLMKDADVYIFDEATSALDKNKEITIFNNLMEELKNKIVIFISHNPELIKKFTKIVFISNGKVIAIGTHSELMNDYDEYKTLYNSYLEMSKDT